jgi:hypothetical protein
VLILTLVSVRGKKSYNQGLEKGMDSLKSHGGKKHHEEGKNRKESHRGEEIHGKWAQE